MNQSKKNTTSANNQNIKLKDDNFFIPHLCNGRSVLLLVLASEMFALIVAIVAYPLPKFNWVSFGLMSLLIQWITLSSAAVMCSMRPWLRRMPPWLSLSICLLFILSCTGVFSLIGQWAMTPKFLASTAFENIDYWTIAQNMLISILMSGMVFRYFVVHHKLRLKEGAELTARLQSLQSRIRPHFLFNSMNIIASLIAVDPEKAETVVEDLSELFRASLKETAKVVPLQAEIDLCKKYAGIEMLRLGKRLTVTWEEKGFKDNTYQYVEIPMLLIQPLLENAIYHGIQPRPEGGVVEIVLDNQGDNFQVIMSNPLPAATYQSGDTNGAGHKHKGNKMALDNIRYRLEGIYHGQGSLMQEQIEDRFITMLSFPSTIMHDNE